MNEAKYERVEETHHKTFEAADTARDELRKKHKIPKKETAGALHRVRVYRRKDDTFRTVLKVLKQPKKEEAAS